WPWNRCPDARGVSVRISVESLSGCAWNGCPSQRGIRTLPFPSSDTRDIAQAALAGLRSLYREGPAYAKAGVILSQFVDRGAITGDLFAPKPREGSDELMRVMDVINAKQGRGAVRLARDTAGGAWSMRREFLSPAYTTAWLDLPVAK
ncbi:DUF4113 domain-containing protein, partial [Pseudomonas aeruginosa]